MRRRYRPASVRRPAQPGITYNFSGVTPSPDVNLAGTTGHCSTNGTGTLAITTLSTNPSAIPNPTVIYTSPNTTGSFTATANAGTAGQTGDIYITVTQRQHRQHGMLRVLHRVRSDPLHGRMMTRCEHCPVSADLVCQAGVSVPGPRRATRRSSGSSPPRRPAGSSLPARRSPSRAPIPRRRPTRSPASRSPATSSRPSPDGSAPTGSRPGGPKRPVGRAGARNGNRR